MSVYKRYNTRRKKLPRGAIIAVLAIATVFALTAALGNHLANKAAGGEALYTGTEQHSSSNNLAPLMEKSLCGEYVAPEDIASFVSANDDEWASTWIYKDGAPTFATETDKLLGNEVSKKLPKVTSFEKTDRTIGLFKVSAVYADEKVKNIVTEYEFALLNEFKDAGLDEVVFVFDEVSDENLNEIFDFVDKFDGAKVLCVPYSTLGNDVFFSSAAAKQLSVALLANGVSKKKLTDDIDTYAFYFTRYNLRLVLDGKDSTLVDILSENALLNYQFSSPKPAKNKS